VRDDALGAPAGGAERLLADHRSAMAVVLVLERKLLMLTSAFDAAGIDVVVLKGPALARAFYPDASWRTFGDIDLLVRDQDWGASCELLATIGFRRSIPEPREGFDRRFGKSATHVDPDGIEVDLHRTLAMGAFGLWLDPELLFARTAPFTLGERSLRRLDDTAALLHACVHASLGTWPPRLLPLRDVAQIAQRGRIDWRAFGDLAEACRLAAVVRAAFDETSRQLDVTLPSAAERWRSREPTWSERRLLAAYASGRRGRGGLALSTLRALPGVRAKAGYVRALLLPDRSFLTARARGGERASYTARWRVPLRWLRARRSAR
jgi:hypothetical protein